ncbi:MAG TPA: DegQ family serine endoprotease [Syntrophales bacterium]|nr:DegQ family serine endoprotease [Syntrophales bacterium]HOX94226.1 DegQ family serine endoprotease [Syntrophales bacterium]HPI55974.1 DegQ family serine endoprotease [Syntrophales bacterium]HPN24136.1 DegQ family serine endoprotease [Syntrophales bacterium]HQM28415.1 DegQ family serine endoprotease [Syntrophales bacterium]
MKMDFKYRQPFFMVLLILLIGFFAISVAGVLRFSVGPSMGLAGSDSTTVSTAATGSKVNFPVSGSAPFSFADLAEKMSPIVVNISTTKTFKMEGRSRSPRGNSHPFERFFGEDDFFRRFFEEMPERELKQRSLGSGFIISPDGYIFTNNHVVEKADKIKVKLSNGKEYDAAVKGRDPRTDIALIKINPEGSLPAAKIGDSDKLRVGDWVVAIGNPFGLDHTVTVGIVSAKGRVIGAGPYDNFIQTDASINPGNSGGPLINLAGEVVGINTAIVAHGQGIGFAIPVNMAKEILNDLKSKGKVTRGWLGVSVQDITDDIAKGLKLKDQAGALVTEVFEGDPADKAGIKQGDIIKEVDGKTVRDTHELLRIVAMVPVGKKVNVKILREGATKDFQVIVAEREESKELAAVRKDMKDNYGMMVQEVTPEVARRLGMSTPAGVIVTEVREGSSAEEAGIQPQDVILQVNKVKINNLKDYQREITKKTAEDRILLLIKRGRGTYYVALKKD